MWKKVAFPCLVKLLEREKLSDSWEILCNGNCTHGDVRKYRVHKDSNIFVMTRRKTERIISPINGVDTLV